MSKQTTQGMTGQRTKGEVERTETISLLKDLAIKATAADTLEQFRRIGMAALRAFVRATN